MKNFFLFFTVMAVSLSLSAQNHDTTETSSPGKFFLGADYSFKDLQLKLVSMSNHSVWDGHDFGTDDLSQDEIDTLNSFVDYKDQFHAINISAGMVLLAKPTSPWYIDGRLILGLEKRKYSIINTNSDSTDMLIKSEDFSPWFGLGFNIRYQFNERWNLSLSPYTMFSSGTTDEVDDQLYPITEFMTESRENKFNLSCTHINLLASYTVKNFTFGLGPGFYLLYNKHEYTIERTNPEDGKVYEDIIKTSLKNETFINGNLDIRWKFTDHFMLYAAAGFSSDITVNAGVLYFL